MIFKRNILNDWELEIEKAKIDEAYHRKKMEYFQEKINIIEKSRK